MSKKFGVVFAKQREALCGLFGFEAQVEQCGIQQRREWRSAERAIGHEIEREILEKQCDVVERITIQFSFRIDRFNDLFKWTVLVILGFNRNSSHRSKYFPASFGPANRNAKRQEIHEAADDILQLAPVA